VCVYIEAYLLRNISGQHMVIGPLPNFPLGSEKRSMNEFHRHTPSLAVLNSLGQPVRAVAYYKHPNPRHLVDTPTHVTANETLHCGRTSQSWDPRLFAEKEAGNEVRPNLTNKHSLSGRLLFADSVDAGWRLTLWDATGQAHLSWDGRGTRQQRIYDELQRPVAVFEREAKQDERRVSRIHYAKQNPDARARNQCGQPTRVDDSAGSLHRLSYSLQGAPLCEGREFLQELTEPDWSREVVFEEREGALPFATSWHYNALGETLSQTDAAGNTHSSIYDVAGQLRESYLLLAGQPVPTLVVSNIQYNAFGQIETETTGNGVINESTYCPQTGRLTRLSAKRPSDNDSDCLQDLNYAYDPVGNILSIEDKSRPVQHCANQCIEPLRTFAYDSLDQLVVASGWEVRSPTPRGPALPGYQGQCLDASQLANYHETYNYDASGNLQEIKHVGAHNFTRRLTTAKGSNRSLLEPNENNENNNRLLTETDLVEAFDENGNLKKLQQGGPTLQWDLRNQLRQVTPVRRDNGQNDSEDYIYDHTGQRLRKVSRRQASGAELIADVRYLPGLEIRTNSATGEILHVISAPAGRSSARVLDWKQAPSNDLQNQQLRYSLDDHLGSSTLELDDQAQVLSQEGYYPYGGTAWWAAANETEAKYKTIRYSGKERDATGLYYYGFRYYAPWLGRWINPDPAGAVDGLNLYRMVKNNPIVCIDDNGLATVTAQLVYGFDVFRDKFQSYRQRGIIFVRIEDLTYYNNITPAHLRDNFTEAVANLPQGTAQYAPDKLDARLKAYVAKTGTNRREATYLMQSWLKYLGDHANELLFTSLIKIDKVKDPANIFDCESLERSTRLHTFINKNAKLHPKSKANQKATFQQLTNLVNSSSPNTNLQAVMNTNPYIASAVIGAFYRKINKLGLDWARQAYKEEDKKIDIETAFVRGTFAAETTDPSDEKNWRKFTPADGTALHEKYYQANEFKSAYLPIQVSAMKHVKKNKYEMELPDITIYK